MMRRLIAIAFTPVLFLVPAAAQEAKAAAQEGKAPAPKDERAAQLLRESAQKMAGLQSFSVHTIESQKSGMAGILPMGDAEDKVVGAVFGSGFGNVTVGDDEHEIVLHHGRMAVKNDKGSWVLRRGVLSDGEEVPFLLEPVALWSALDRIAGSATMAGPATVQGVQVENVEVEVKEDLARELAWSGALPLPRGGFGGMVFMAIGGAGIKQPAPELTYRLTISIDPATRFIQRIRAKGLRHDAMGAAGVFMAGAPVAVEVEAEKEEGEKEKRKEKEKETAKKEVKEEEGEKPAPPLPVFGARAIRVMAGPGGVGIAGGDGEKKKDGPTTEFSISFKDHGTAKHNIPEAARAVLQGPQPQRDPQPAETSGK